MVGCNYDILYNKCASDKNLGLRGSGINCPHYIALPELSELWFASASPRLKKSTGEIDNKKLVENINAKLQLLNPKLT